MLDKNIKSATDQPVFALGRQLTLEYYDCGAGALLDKAIVERTLLKAARDSGATVISSSFHQFAPQGVSGVVIIAESHFTVHAWPEHNYAAVDIFTCGDNIDLNRAIGSMQDGFGSRRVVVSSDQNRGLLNSEGQGGDTTRGTLVDRETLPISWRKAYEQALPWGVLTSVDLYDCDPAVICDSEYIEKFVVELCEKIRMKRFGECRIVHFGEDEKVAGYSMTQLIETSLISGHFANAANAAYLDIFSCKFYEPREVAEFALSFFKADNYKMQISLRQ
ncbi:MAG: adenosylmethionine decarboxylase [Desulfobacter sp.]|nr:MAG: adenosylmethionine decarboxylase [Desulfobacter sp.]